MSSPTQSVPTGACDPRSLLGATEGSLGDATGPGPLEGELGRTVSGPGRRFPVGGAVPVSRTAYA